MRLKDLSKKQLDKEYEKRFEAHLEKGTKTAYTRMIRAAKELQRRGKLLGWV